MNKCYRCETDLIEKGNASEKLIREKKYKSEEHIIPNFCGGKLTSEELLCEKCNNELGHELDRKLSRQILLHDLFPIKLDRGKQRDRKLIAYTIETNQKVLVKRDGSWFHFKPIYEIEDGEIVKLICNTMSQAKETLKGLARKHPKIDVNNCLKKMVEKNEGTEVRVNYNVAFGGSHGYRAIAKIALNFYLYCGFDITFVEKFKKYVIKPDISNDYVSFYYSVCPIHELKPNEVSHILFLKGDNRKQILYCYIELFNTLNFLVMLDDNYLGENFEKTYAYDVLGDKEIRDKTVSLSLLRNIFEELKFKVFYDKYYEEIDQYIEDRMTRAFAILDTINKNI